MDSLLNSDAVIAGHSPTRPPLLLESRTIRLSSVTIALTFVTGVPLEQIVTMPLQCTSAGRYCALAARMGALHCPRADRRLAHVSMSLFVSGALIAKCPLPLFADSKQSHEIHGLSLTVSMR